MTSSKLGRYCDHFIEAGWLLAVIIAPLFFNVYSSRSIEPDKIALVRALAALMAAAWLIQWIDRRRAASSTSASSLRLPLIAPTLALIAVNLLATLTSLAPDISFFGEYVRPEGFHTLLAYALIFWLAARGLCTRPQLDRLINTLVLASLPVAAYSLLQKLQLDPMTWTGDMSTRVGASLGNPIFLGAYLIMVFCLTIGLLTSLIRSGQRQPARIVVVSALAVLQAAAIVFAGSRGPWVGWLAGLSLFALLSAVVTRHPRAIRFVLGICGGSAIVIGLLNIPNTPLEPIRSLSTIGALGHLFEGESGTGQVRTLTWQGNAQLVFGRTPVVDLDGATDRFDALRPFIGYGPDTMYLAFSQITPPELAAMTGHNALSDRSHNETWDTVLNTGVAGLIVYQWLFVSLFLFGLRRLELVTTRHQRNEFIALWIGLGVSGAVATLLLNQAKYFGLALPIGNVLGLGIYLIKYALTDARRSQPIALRAEQILIIALLAGILAHYVETQFGLAVVGTRLMFWLFAAMLVSPAAELPVITTVTTTRSSRATALSYGLLIAVAVATLTYEFIAHNDGLTDPVAILLRALTFDRVHNLPSLAFAGLLLVTWGVSNWLIWSSQANMPRRWLTPLVSLILPIGFAAGVAAQLAVLIVVPLPVDTAYNNTLIYGSQITGLFDYYSLCLLGVMLALAVVLLIESAPAGDHQPIGWWRPIAAVPIVIAAGVWINTIDLNPIRADIYFKLGQEYVNYPQASVILYQQAVRLVPGEDYYYPELGSALRQKADRSVLDSAPVFNDESQLADLMKLDSTSTVQLSRADSLYAALLAFWQARDLNPLQADHSLNLAHFFKPDLPVDTAARRALVERADAYYAQALKIRPLNARFWNDWAEFDLVYHNDPDLAMAKLTDSLQLDPNFNETYVLLGRTYTAKQDLNQAAAAYQQAISLRPDVAEAYAKLAFVYHQQDNLPGAIEAFRAYIQLSPDAPNAWEAHKNLALIYKQSGNMPQAIAELEIAASLAEDNTQKNLNDLVKQWQAQ